MDLSTKINRRLSHLQGEGFNIIHSMALVESEFNLGAFQSSGVYQPDPRGAKYFISIQLQKIT